MNITAVCQLGIADDIFKFNVWLQFAFVFLMIVFSAVDLTVVGEFTPDEAQFEGVGGVGWGLKRRLTGVLSCMRML